MAEAFLQMRPDDLPKAYEPTEVERRWYLFWMDRGYFTADAHSAKPPNVTGSLHLGHALTATLEDILIRWKRMSGFNCLWLPGIDHAGISTQLMVERELVKTEGKDRHQLGRAAIGGAISVCGAAWALPPSCPTRARTSSRLINDRRPSIARNRPS